MSRPSYASSRDVIPSVPEQRFRRSYPSSPEQQHGGRSYPSSPPQHHSGSSSPTSLDRPFGAATFPQPPERHHRSSEHFAALRASLGATSQTRLQHKRRLSLRDSDNTFLSTAIAPNGWLAAATASEVRLFDVDHQDSARDITPNAVLRPKPHDATQGKAEPIRAIAISDDLLAVVTHMRLIVYEYREAGDVADNVLHCVGFGQKASWTPRSVAILQVESTDTYQSAAAWVAVGGEGVNGVKLYQYSKMTCWSPLRECVATLKCPQNTGAMRTVGFSSFVRCNCFYVFGVTSGNRVLCWEVRSRATGRPMTVSRTPYNINVGQSSSPHRGEITAVDIFESPSGIPYILCAIDQRPGSQLHRSFVAPLGATPSQWRTLPDEIASRGLLSAAASPNGRFLVTVGDGAMKLLMLKVAYGGGLTCHERMIEWPSSLKDTAKDVSAISLRVREAYGSIEVTGVDGRGHLVTARVNVPDMPVSPPPSLTMSSVEIAELPAEELLVVVPELCGTEIRRSIIASSTQTRSINASSTRTNSTKSSSTRASSTLERDWAAFRQTLLAQDATRMPA